MKLWEILSRNSKCNAEDIARELVILEKTLPEFEKTVKEEEKKAIRLRQIKLGGGKTDDNEMKVAGAKLETAKLDLEAVKKSIEELQEILKEAVKTQRDKEAHALEDEKKKVEESEQKARLDLIKAGAILRALQMRFTGDSRVDNTHIEITFLRTTEESQLFQTEVKRQLERLEKE